MLNAVAICLLAAAPLRIAVPAFKGVQVSEDLGDFFSEDFAHALAAEGYRVVTTNEIASLVGFEKQKIALGCTDKECMAELADALGVDALAKGSLGKFEDAYEVNLTILSVRTAQSLASFSGQATGEKAALAMMKTAARECARQLRAPSGAGLARADAAAVSVPAPPSRWGPREWAWVPLLGGAVIFAAGTVCVTQAASDHYALVSEIPAPTVQQAQHARDEGPAYQAVGSVLLGLGAAAIGTGVWMRWAGAPVTASMTVGRAPGVALSGNF